ncbi:cytochrome P450 [Cladochytrium replicatum]|nr:cytochrome P450 [Cladochytrium replicatum]
MLSAVLVSPLLLVGLIVGVVAYLHVRMYQRATAFRRLNPGMKIHTVWHLGFLLFRVMFRDLANALDKRWPFGWVYKLKYRPFLDTKDDVFAIVNPFSTEVYVANADIVRQIALSRVSEFPKPIRVYAAMQMFGPNILTLELDEWKRHRRVAGPHFSERLNREVVDASLKIVDELFEIWGNEAEIDLGKTLSKVTLCILGETVFGVPFGLERQSIISGPNDVNSISGTLLRSLVNAVKEEEDPRRRLSEQELISSVFVFLIAGHDTTANVLTYTLGLLAIHPEYQDILLNETRKLVRDDEELKYERYPELYFAHAIVNESMRLFPTVPFIGKLAGADDPNLKNTFIWINPIGLHYNPKYWGDDLEDFRPERFLSTDTEDSQTAVKAGETGEKVHKYAFLPFSVGPRACIGRKFALVEMAMILTLLNREYTWKPAPSMGEGLDGEDAEIRWCREALSQGVFLTAMKPENPIKIMFSRRLRK